MKTTLAILCSLLLAGCATGPEKEQTCAAATTAYAIYLAVINSGGEPSQGEIQAAAAAAAFLTSFCAWSPAVVVRGGAVTITDEHGVPVIRPDKR